jgi:hypothetical protein
MLILPTSSHAFPMLMRSAVFDAAAAVLHAVPPRVATPEAPTPRSIFLRRDTHATFSMPPRHRRQDATPPMPAKAAAFRERCQAALIRY